MKLKNKQQPPKIFIISGPSGAGEDAVLEKLKKKIKFNRVITTVTRKMRPGEKQGKPYYFVSVGKFKKMIKAGELIEWADVYDSLRGATKKEIARLLKLNRPILWKIDWQGVRAVKKIFPKAIAIFITVPNYKVLELRLINRGQDSLAEIKKRKAFTENWLKKKSLYDYRVINRQGKLEQTVLEVIKIIKREDKKP